MERFIELYESVYRDLYRLAYYYLGNSQDAEDAVSETALKAYEKYHTLREQTAFKAWIFRILVNQCRMQLRKKSVSGSYELMDPANGVSIAFITHVLGWMSIRPEFHIPIRNSVYEALKQL